MVDAHFYLQDQELETIHETICSGDDSATSFASPPNQLRNFLTVPSEHEEGTLQSPEPKSPGAVVLRKITSAFSHQLKLSRRSHIPWPSSQALLSWLIRRECPPASLLPELLIMIFEQSHTDNGPFDPRTAITYSHVCRLWREVALQTPFLWTTVNFSPSLEAGKAFIERSKISPIHIKMPPVPIREGQDSSEFALIPFEPKHFERIQSLTWSARNPFTAALTFDDEQDCTLSIRHLDLRGVSLSPWERFTDLTHLTLHDLNPRYICPSTGELLALLERSPRIQEVSFMNLDPAISEPEPDAELRPLILHNLERFFLEGPIAYTLMRSPRPIIIPSTAAMWTPCTDHGHDLSRLHWHGEQRRLLINPDGVSIEVGGTIVGHTGFEISDRNVLSDDNFPLLVGMARTLQLAPVRTIWCRDYCNKHEHTVHKLSIPLWETLLKPMTELEEVSLNALPMFMIHFLVALWPCSSTDPVQVSLLDRNQFHPNLRSLKLETALEITPETSKQMGVFVLAQLKWRKRWVKEPLEKLKMNFGDDEIHEELKAFVKELKIAEVRASTSDEALKESPAV